MGICVLRGDVLRVAIFRSPFGGGGRTGSEWALVDDAGGVWAVVRGGGSGGVTGQAGATGLGSVRTAGARGIWKIILGGDNMGICEHDFADGFDVRLASFLCRPSGDARGAHSAVRFFLGGVFFAGGIL